MDVKAEQKYILLSPSKIRPLAKLTKKMKPVEALEKLPFIAKRASEPIVKVIKSALANARAKGLADTDMIFKEIQIGEGPRLKRGNPVSRGQWHQIKKRMSHIRVILQTANSLQSTAYSRKEKTIAEKAVDSSQLAVSTTERSKRGTKS